MLTSSALVDSSKMISNKRLEIWCSTPQDAANPPASAAAASERHFKATRWSETRVLSFYSSLLDLHYNLGLHCNTRTMATIRVRKAFRYPSESDSEPDELDEEHQERLIADLQAQDAHKNDLYRKGFLSIPIIGALFFIYTFVIARTARERLIALLSISSLICTAYVLHFMPIEAPDRKGKRPMYQIEAGRGPVESYIVYLNAALAGLLLIAAGLSWRKHLREDAWREALPASTFRLNQSRD